MAVTLLGAIVAMVPPTNSANRSLFALKVVGGCGIMIAVGLVFYFRGRRLLATQHGLGANLT